MSESRIPPLTFKTHDISFYKIETNDGGIGLKVSGTMDATQKKDMRPNLNDTLASLKEQVLPTSVVAGSAHFLRFMHQKHRASRIRRHRMNSIEIIGILMIFFWAAVFCLIYCFGVGHDDVDENREAATPWWLTIFANLIGHFEDAAGRARPAIGDLELGNVDRVYVVPEEDVREISDGVVTDEQLTDVPTAVVDTTETFYRIMDRIRSLAGNRQPIPEATPVANTATQIEGAPEDPQLD